MNERDNTIEIIARGIWCEQGHILVCRNRERGHVFLPGGHVEFNETAPVALARELQEEAGLAVTVGGLLAIVEAGFDQTGKRGPRRHHEINLLLHFQPATPPAPPKSARPSLPVIQSLESHIEFIWRPLPPGRPGNPAAATATKKPAAANLAPILPHGIEALLHSLLKQPSATPVLHSLWT